jgi:hypothetical protein
MPSVTAFVSPVLMFYISWHLVGFKISSYVCTICPAFLLDVSNHWDNVKQDLHNIHQCITKMDEENQSVESMWNIFQTKLQKSIQKNIPQKKARKKDGC